MLELLARVDVTEQSFFVQNLIVTQLFKEIFAFMKHMFTTVFPKI